MLYKFFNKKGNIIVILIGITFVMILMAIALTKRMSGHTQLLTLSDYTQINRYFLESYMGDVMQQLRFQVNNPSELSKYITENKIEDIQGKNLLDHGFTYTACDELKYIAKELKINIKKPKIEIVDPNELEDADCLIDYPQGITPGAQDGKEKKGLIKIVCECSFNKRKYKLEVRYPFSIVFRMTPVLKDFMLFVDNMDKAQANNKDYINLLLAEEEKYSEKETRYDDYVSNGVKPLVLLQPLDGKFNTAETSGKVYLGKSNSPIYINLAGGSYTSDINETDILCAQDLGVATSSPLDLVQFLPKPGASDSDAWLSLPGWSIPLKNSQEAKMSVMGFSNVAGEVFKEVADKGSWDLKDFIKDDNTWDLVKCGKNLKEALSYASALKLYGLNGDIPNREIFGNVFARYIVLTFWNPNRTTASGQPLDYDTSKTINSLPEIVYAGWGREYEQKLKFEPLDDGSLYDSNVDYQFFMSRIVSGYDWKNPPAHVDRSENNFKPMNIKINLQNIQDSGHVIFNEGDFRAADGFEVDKNSIKFDDFAKKWFGYSTSDNAARAPIEVRIGRAFSSQEKFKEAVGYKDSNGKDKNQNFQVNGVVYVKGDLNLSNGMILDYEDNKPSCSGGIVLVDGKITLGNIYRREILKTNDFVLMRGSSRPAEDKFKEWTNPAKKNYIGSDKILTFVSINRQPIIVKGNVLLGVQLINILSPDGNEDQIKFELENTNNGLIFYGSIACNRLKLEDRVKEFGKIKSYDDNLKAPFFIYPPVMATSTPPLAVQISENMRDYSLTSSGEGN